MREKRTTKKGNDEKPMKVRLIGGENYCTESLFIIKKEYTYVWIVN